MKSPFFITKQITFDILDYGISSEKYLINHLEDYMEQFGMRHKRLSENEIYYFNMDPFKSMKRRKLIRNLSIKVEIDEEIKIYLKTEIIFISAIFFASIIIPIFTTNLSNTLIIAAFGFTLSLFNYLLKSVIMNSFEKEIKQMMLGIR